MLKMRTSLAVLLVAGLVGWVCEGLPLVKRQVNGIEVPPPEILRFMRRFGYLMPNKPNDAETLYHESAIVEAIKNIQKYGALNQTGALDNATLDLFNKPRCGVPDIEGIPYYLLSGDATTTTTSTTTKQPSSGRSLGRKRDKRYVIGARTWTKRRIRYFIANWSRKVPRDQVERDLARAFSVWSQYSGLRFVRSNDTAAEIIVGFGSQYHGDNYPFDGPGNILAHAFYPYEMDAWGGDLHFDEDENWAENSTDLANGVDFYSVALHELGHSLGLAHSPVFNSIMFPYYKGPEHNVLDYDDTLAMHEMYLSKELTDDDYDDAAVAVAVQPEARADTDTLETTTEDATTKEPTTTAFTPTFRGDFATIRQYKKHYTFAPTSIPSGQSTITTRPSVHGKPQLPAIPDICQGAFDAVTSINGSVYIFKQEYVWKLTPRYTVIHGYPLNIHVQFPFLPETVKRIDAAYQRYDGAIVIFTGPTFWVFNSTDVLENSPQPIAHYTGNVQPVDKVDAAMLWPKNNFTYLFAGSMFWRYNDWARRLEVGYPKSMLRWPGIPSEINAAATLSNGKTYFFKDNLYWLYNNANVRPERGYPRRASSAWLGCAPPTKTPLRNSNTTVSFISSFASTSAPAKSPALL